MDDLDYRKDLFSRVFIYNEEKDLDDNAISGIKGDTFEVLQLLMKCIIIEIGQYGTVRVMKRS